MQRHTSAFESETFDKDGSFDIDKPVGSASISPCGRDIVLGSRQGLDIIDLESPYAPPRHLPHFTPWEVADVQWSPFAARDYWIVSTSNQKALVWNLSLGSPNKSNSSIEHVLHGHKRAITDINFSAHYPDILATSGVDSFVHCWDLRRPSKPAVTFCDWFAGATQVKWNRQNPHVLASSHDKFLKIWDDRKGAQPVRTIAAHSTKIYGVDWDRVDSHKLATCSLDHTIKFWDYTDEEEYPKRTICTTFPVWRARHTPFGFGLVALPQRSDFDLHLYDRRQDPEELPQNHKQSTSESVHQFAGHQGQVKEFLWRARGNVTSNVDERDFQLVSWGEDKVLRLHEVDEKVCSKVGFTKGMEIKRTMNFTRRGAKYISYRDAPAQSHDDDAFNYGGPPRPAFSSGLNRGNVSFASGYGSEGFMSAANKQKVAESAMDPLSWMRGVKFRKRARSSNDVADTPGLQLAPKLSSQWDLYDSLGEEMTAVLDKFPNVKAEKIDVQNRTLTLSFPNFVMRDRPHVQLKCRLDFPSGYPFEASPTFAFVNPNAYEEASVQAISNDLTDLVREFWSHKRYVLEAILRYLLGEVTLDESLKWLQKPRDLSTADVDQELASSSDEEYEDSARFARSNARGSGIGDSMIAVDNAQYNVPLPNTCGARWTAGGMLVCFFPPKQEMESSLFGRGLGLGSRLSGSSKGLFEDFGRSNRSYREKWAASTRGTANEKGRDEADFELSSSASSSSSTGLATWNHPFLPTVPWNAFNSGVQAGQPNDISQKSVGETGQTNHASTTASRTNMIVSITQIEDLTLANKDLAAKYSIAQGYQSALTNGDAAMTCGYIVRAEIWRLCCILLERAKSIGTISAQDVKPISHSSIDVALEPSLVGDNGSPAHRYENSLTRSDLWFERWLISAIFKQLKRTKDIQTIAMLTCVLRVPQPSTTTMHHTEPKKGLFRQDSQINCEPQDTARKVIGDKPQRASLDWRSDLNRFFSRREQAGKSNSTVPSKTRAGLPNNLTPPGVTVPRHDKDRNTKYALSSSPNDSPGLRRTSSTLNTLAIPFSRPHQISYSATSSPPKRQDRRESTPFEKISSSLELLDPGAVAHWFSKGSLGSNDSQLTPSPPKQTQRTSALRNAPAKSPGSFSYKMKNQHHFRPSVSAILDPAEQAQYQCLRASYASILEGWEMPMQKVEIMKFNSRIPPSASQAQRTSTEKAAPSQDRSLQFAALPQGSRLCTYCQTHIKGLSSPCIHCGHTVHLECRIALRDNGIEDCVTGCGCRCSEHQMTEISMPTPPTPPAPQPSSHSRQVSYSRQISRSSTGLEDKPQRVFDLRVGGADDGAYTSLAKTLATTRRDSSKGLRATASQIWRGGS